MTTKPKRPPRVIDKVKEERKFRFLNFFLVPMLIPGQSRAEKSVPDWRKGTYNGKPHQGQREIERRRRRIALREENGLCRTS